MLGGFGVAPGCLLLVGEAGADELRPGVLVAVVVALFGTALGRLVSGMVDQPTAFYPVWFHFWVELLSAGAPTFAVTG